MDGGGEVIIITSMHRPVPSELLVTYLLPRHCAGGCFLCLDVCNCIHFSCYTKFVVRLQKMFFKALPSELKPDSLIVK